MNDLPNTAANALDSPLPARLSIERLRAALAALFTLSAHRTAEEQRIRGEYEHKTDAVRKSSAELDKRERLEFEQERQSLEAAYDAAQRKAASDFRAHQAAIQLKYDQDRKDVSAEFAEQQKTAEARLTHETWEATTVFDARQPALAEQLSQAKGRVAAHAKASAGINQAANDYLIACRCAMLLNGDANEIYPPPAPGDPFQHLAESVQTADAQLQRMKELALPKLFIAQRVWLLLPAVWLPLAGFAVLFFRDPIWQPLAGATLLSVPVFAALVYLLKRRAVRSLADAYRPVRQFIGEGQRLQEACLVQAQAYFESQRLKSVAKRDRELQAARERFSRTTVELVQTRDAALAQLDQDRAQRQAEAIHRRDAALTEAHETYPQRLETLEQKHQEKVTAIAEALRQTLVDAAGARDRDTAALLERWQTEMQNAGAVIKETLAENERLFPHWSSLAWSEWKAPASAPPAVRFGEFQIDLAQAGRVESNDDRFATGLPDRFALPALLPFPANASLLIKASGEGKRQAIDGVQAVMLRMLSTIPPGKLKFTIIDPVGLGENFAGFMHLADYDESLVANRIWTEPAHIEQRLTGLTEQMENVIQKYLRNDFRSIEEYNAFAGEVAEAFRVLVVANFPVNFTEAAARRLSSIVASGARCGVFALITIDTKQPLPAKFDLADIERHSTTVAWIAGRFVWKDPDFGRFSLQLDVPPLEDQFSKIVHAVGESTKSLQRVEVPFEYIVPPVDRYWTGDASGGIDVPLGRIGATKLQHLRLGRGTAQHVLVAGKTGSGKSTLLHALVTNLSLIYSPQEVELYLVDFKKGVEFKTYATHELPHARVIAVESEREFGLSVLERLDGELKHRGDRFRALGVQDLAGYRAADPATPMPRVLLVVDEFQELFVDDDRLAQQSALLLDRLVRQGRAFGIHVLLGSQTLGGAYSLARSTIGQMAVRIALQCSETDAHLILSDDNSAARLLSRPGEAIYNDANGLIEGNSPFQVVWLGDERREHYLEQVRELSRQRLAGPRPRPIVFDGHQAADLRGNRLLERLFDNGTVSTVAPNAWLGDAVAIKDPTSAVLRRQGGANLLIVGQQEEAARGMLAGALLSLAAQHPAVEGQRSGAQFYILEAPRDGASDQQLRHLSAVVPHTVHVVGRREEGPVTTELAAEVARRQEDDQRAAPPIYLFIFDLARFRELRRSDDDMGFSFGGEARPPSPARLFATVLRDGPEVGVHSLIWCDSAASLARVFDRQALREFDLRVLMQMSAGDSSQLIDTPIASKLGTHYALLHDEEAGRLEKFRPYGWPDLQWLADIAVRFKHSAAATDRLPK